MAKLIHYRKEGKEALCGARFLPPEKITEDGDKVNCVECKQELAKNEARKYLFELEQEKEE